MKTQPNTADGNLPCKPADLFNLAGTAEWFAFDDKRHPADPPMVNTETDRTLIGQALAQLSAEQRAVVRRSSHQAWSTAQIADDLQIAEDTVKSRLHYALRALRFTLQEMGVDTTPQSQSTSRAAGWPKDHEALKQGDHSARTRTTSAPGM